MSESVGSKSPIRALAAHIVENDYLNGTTIRIDGAQRFGMK